MNPVKKEKADGKQNAKTGETFLREDGWGWKTSKQKTVQEKRQKQHNDSAGDGQMKGAIIEEPTQNPPTK